MKIQVVRCDGDIETIHLIGTVKVSEPKNDGQGSLMTESTGTTHFFRADGAYDGWDMEVGEWEGGLNDQDMARFIAAVEKDREVRKRNQKPGGTA